MASQQRLQSLSEQYQTLEQVNQSHIQSRQKLESQQQENKSVQKEFADLEDGAKIYKLMGPILLKQDKAEAVMAVDRRLEFIDKEIKRVESQIKDTQEKTDKVRMEIIQLQSATQQGSQTQAVA